MSIRSDAEFKVALNKLPVPKQRQLAARFVESVDSLCQDPRVSAVIKTATRADMSDVELAAAYQTIRTACVDSYTQCGHEADWQAQAGHFVAKAARACVMPDTPAHDVAWTAAMHARMASTFAAIASGQGTENREADRQYQILEAFINR